MRSHLSVVVGKRLESLHPPSLTDDHSDCLLIANNNFFDASFLGWAPDLKTFGDKETVDPTMSLYR